MRGPKCVKCGVSRGVAGWGSDIRSILCLHPPWVFPANRDFVISNESVWYLKGVNLSLF